MLLLKSLIGVAFQVAGFAALLLLPAGTGDWPRAVQFLACYGIIVTVAVFALAWLAPGALEARLQPPFSETQPVADQVATALLCLILLAWFVFIPVDVFHLQLLPRPSLLVSLMGAFISIVGLGIILLTHFQNEFLAPMVTDQSERGQSLIDTGLYGYVRHPMYSGILLWLFGLALWLESTAGAIATLAVLLGLLVRMRIEERTLRETLQGYGDYMTRVRFRLVPFVW